MNVGGALDRIRTCGTLLRRQVLYPLSYEGTIQGPDRRVLRYYRAIAPPRTANPQNTPQMERERNRSPQ